LNLTNTGDDNEEDGAWSPDETSIAFVSDRDGNDEIYVMSAQGTGLLRVTSNAVPDNEVGWSPCLSE
jgi:Tol biopolymer transport system component